MFKVDATPAGQAAQEFWSFAEVAAEMGAGIGDLQRAMEDVRHRGPWVTGFRAVAMADCERVLADAERTGALTPLPGFADLVAVADVEKVVGAGAFAETVARLGVPVVRVECLTAEGRDYALAELVYLKDENPPAGLDATQIAAWRRTRASVKTNAEVEKAATVGGRRPPRGVAGAEGRARRDTDPQEAA